MEWIYRKYLPRCTGASEGVHSGLEGRSGAVVVLEGVVAGDIAGGMAISMDFRYISYARLRDYIVVRSSRNVIFCDFLEFLRFFDIRIFPDFARIERNSTVSDGTAKAVASSNSFAAGIPA